MDEALAFSAWRIPFRVVIPVQAYGGDLNECALMIVRWLTNLGLARPIFSPATIIARNCCLDKRASG